ncbi:thiamine diphosphokinase [Coriobacteriia bacterium Es71-Z0120]|uniref:thiamine diphosphokinase n=1 Tax=Parvivirga hydrogeniphila TaxID=2939460 RepID=UPI002260835E|nr:thiamine diphosphokinase [Parvivirga hydrogeniphila]MCL4079545.1 thiamine diphosphokinase [Parvivirga hydrogeniphila]
MTQEALIVGAAPRLGSMEFYRALLARFELVIACDAAAEWALSLGRAPQYAIGDFDSAARGAAARLAAAGVEVLAFPSEKDETDLDLAAAHARALGVESLAFTAAFSGRLDHTLAALGTMRRHAACGPVAFEPDFSAWLLAQEGRAALTVDAPAGAVVSVVALEPVRGLSVRNARFSADSIAVDLLSGRTISNESVGEPVRVSLQEGSALVMLLHSLQNTL